MALRRKGKKSRRERLRELAAGLAPLESRRSPEKRPRVGGENGGGPNPADDTIRVDTGPLKLSEDFVEGAGNRRERLLWMDPAVAFVVVIALCFIAFIAYLIWSGAPPVD